MGKIGRFFQNLVKQVKLLFRWASIWITRIVKFITVDIWHLNVQNFSKWKARLIRDAKVVILMLTTFSEEKIGYQVSALSYRSVMSVVPFLAIAFYITSRLGLSPKFAEFLYANISNERLINNMIEAANNIVVTAQSGLFGFISMASFIWIVIWMMISVRSVFNNVWRVGKEKNFFKMIGIVLMIIILSPFVILILFSGSIFFTNVLDVIFPSQILIFEQIKSFLGWAIFAGIVISLFAVMYKFIPGTHVHFRHAWKAALFSGIGFAIVQYLYVETQMMVMKVSAVYGTLAIIPLFMVWMNLAWTIILYGAELSYAFQEVERLNTTSSEIDEKIHQAREEKKRNLKL